MNAFLNQFKHTRWIDQRRWPQVLAIGAIFMATIVITMGADKNGVSPNTISLPKGPGSIEGLGESFQPTLNTGTAKYGLAIKLPPGTAGHQPSFALSYDGGGGNGPLGYGWNLSLPHIQRRTDKGIPTYGEPLGVQRPDTFITDSREELVPTTDGFFFCENESSFIRYRQVGDHWEGTGPDGTRLEFGVSTNARIADGARTFTWLLERETDTHGNVIEYVYRSFPGGQNLNQKYLSQVRYGPGAPAVGGAWPAFHFVAFEYEDRPDWFEDGRAGFLVRTGKRLRSVRVATQGASLTNHLAGDFNADGITDYLNRRYELNYLRYAGTESHWSLLASVKLTGADGLTALPTAEFNYAVSHPPTMINVTSNIWSASNAPFAVMDNAHVDLIDLNADGLPDILKTDAGGGGHTVAVNRGPVRTATGWAVAWANPVEVDSGSGTAVNFDLSSDGTHLADMDGDGLADLVHKTADDTVFYFANRGRLGWGQRRDMSLGNTAPPTPFGNPGVRTADIDFDKRIDIIQSVDIGGRTGYRVWFNLGNQAYSEPQAVESEGGFDFALPGVQVADCNGDRVPDVARIQPGAVVVAAGLGYGRFTAPLSLVLPDMTLDDLQIAAAKLTDINGDGLADLVIERATPGVCWYWLNLGNYRLDPRRIIEGLPAVSSGAAVRWVDMNGNGTTDLIYSDSTSESRLTCVEIGVLVSGGIAPNLLTQIGNGIGRQITVEYAPSTRFALEDAAANRPWPDTLPFPVTVVASFTTSDSLGHEYVTRFRYHDGYYDPIEKQFRGFGEVEQIDVGDPSAPTLINRSFFDTGRIFEAMKGRLLQASAETDDGDIFFQETTTWANPPRVVRTGTNGLVVRFAHPTAMVKEVRERDAGTPRRLESESQYDDYGNVTRQSDYGIVENSDRSAVDDERITLTEFALNTNRWIIHAPKRQITQDENGVVLSRSEMFYDDETFSGNNLGSVTTGKLTLRRDWINPADATAFVNSTRSKYDAYGNAVLLLDPLAPASADPAAGHVREIAYDAAFHTYGQRETIYLGSNSPPLVATAGHDEGLALVRYVIDFNGHTTSCDYDALGRLTRMVRPGDTAAFPTAEYDYALAVPARLELAGGLVRTGLVNQVETRMLDRAPGTAGAKRDHYFIQRQFSDGLGRALMTRTEAEALDGSTMPRVAVAGAVLFNARAKPARVLSPFFTSKTGSLDDLLSFENIEAPGWQGQFHLNGQLVTLGLANAHQSSTEYDAALRVVRSINPDGTFERTEFEPLVVRSFDENDTTVGSPHFETPRIEFSDGLGRLIRVDEIVRLNDDGTTSATPQTWTTRYRYDLNDRLTRITDALSNVKELRYDGLERKLWMNDPDAGISTNAYDAASNLIETVDAKGQRIRYTYDGANRMLTEDYEDEASPEFSYRRSPDVVFHYDTPAGPVDQGDGTRATSQNTKGMLAWVEDTSGREYTSFDARGRIEWAVKQIPDPVLAPNLEFRPQTAVSYKTAFAHDSIDRITRIIYPDNDEVSYRYNARNLLAGITGGPSGNILSNLTYLPSAQQERIDYGNGVRTTYAYDGRQRLSRLLTRHQVSNVELVHFTYDLDPVSNVEAIHDQRPALAVPLDHPRRNSQRFAYDSLYRLTRVQYNNSPNSTGSNGGEINYRYDRIANLLSQTSNLSQSENGVPVANLGSMTYGGAAGRTGRVGRLPNDPPGPHALTAIQSGSTNRPFAYDANGNMTTIDGMRSTWDFRDRLVALENDDMRAEYRYDHAGQRVIKRVTWKKDPSGPSGTNSPAGAAPKPVSTSSLYPGDHFEVREADQPTKYVFHGETRVAQVVGSFSTNDRIQRIRLQAGPNLLSLAVTVKNLAGQLQAGAAVPGPVVTAVQRWNEATGSYTPVTTGQTVPARAILWIHAATNAVLSVVGSYTEPTPQHCPPGGGYVAGPGLEAWSLPFPLDAWAYSTGNRRWSAQLASGSLSVSELPARFPPGQPLYIASDDEVEVLTPDPKLRVRFYHSDHLGSSAVMTDASGALLEETAYYPSGVPRHEHRLKSIEENYTFTGKERDRESKLHYFEARFLAASISRFISVDPKYVSLDGLSGDELSAFLSRPQAMNLYSYGYNNPITYTDPTGLEAIDKVAKTSDVTGVVGGAAEEGTMIAMYKGANPPKWIGGAAGVAGKVTAGISVGIATYKFAKNPNSATGGQLVNESAKALTGLACPPVGLIWSVLDLTGYGPSAILEATDKTIEAHKRSAAAYKQAAAAYRETARIINEAAPKIEAKQQHAKERLKVLNQKTAAWHQKSLKSLKGETRSLAELNAAIAKQERANKQTAARLKYWQARARKAQ